MTISLQIDGRQVSVPEGLSLRKAALHSGIYVPGLCGHPDLPHAKEVKWAAQVYRGNDCVVSEFTNPTAGEDACCNLCWVTIESNGSLVRACETPVTEGIVVRTKGEDLQHRRHEALSKILAHHPHACLTCAQKQGCSLTQCSSNVPVEERCCILLNRCELGKVVDFIGLPEGTPRYTFEHFHRTTDDPFFERDYNLCIGCTRCVRICAEVRGVDALAVTWKNDRVWVGTSRSGLMSDSYCRFCGACVEVCPTGALQDKPGSQPVHPGETAPCIAACPAGIDIPGYLRSIAEGDFAGALEVIYDRVPLPGVLGYVCFHPCEAACKRDSLDQSLAICSLKRFVYDSVPDKSIRPVSKKPDTGHKVAVIGSGPAGLSAAFYLARAGHSVVVFEASQQPGGMLRYAIPEYRMPLPVLEDELDLFRDLGITFHTGMLLGENITVNNLLDSGFDAVLLAVGTVGSRCLGIPGEDLFGVTQALDLLRLCRNHEGGEEPALEGRVVVIGGGNVAIDAAMSARRLGPSQVTMICLESAEQMPAHAWEIAQATEEGIQIQNGWGPAEFIGEEGKLTKIRFKRCTRVFDDSGRFNPAYDETETFEIEADHAIIAIGQKLEKMGLDGVEGLTFLPNGTIAVNASFQIGNMKIFATGDAVSGPGSVIQAIADGRKAADNMDKFLGGPGLETPLPVTKPNPFLGQDEEFHQRSAVRPYLTVADERVRDFSVFESTLTPAEAQQEALRCMRCNLRAFITPAPLPPDKWIVLSLDKVTSIPAVEGVIEIAGTDRKPVRIAGVQDMRAALETECRDRQGDWLFTWEADHMYSKRESELIQQHLQAYGEMPGGGAGELDDLF